VSPFAETLRALRLSRGIRQKDLAARAGYEQSYLSALEMGSKGRPSSDFLRRISVAMQLSSHELVTLRAAARHSQRRYFLPPDSRPVLYTLCSELWRELPNLTESSLKNSFPERPTSRHHVGGNAAVKQSGENEDAKKPQLPQDHPEVVTGAAQHRVASHRPVHL
jgi:transcriptional regulator with XRE-family HTH domain